MASLDSTKADAMRQFLNDHRLTMADFSKDEAAERRLRPQFRQERGDLEQRARQQARLYGDNPAVKEQFMLQADELRRRQRELVQQASIDETMGLAGRDPDAFKKGLEQSRSADDALQEAPYARGGALSGLVAGGVAGDALGRLGARANKVNPRFFGPVGGIAGAGLGLIGGRLAGRAVNQNVTGRRYDEVRAPYEIARGLDDGTD